MQAQLPAADTISANVHTIRHPGRKCPRRTDRLCLCLLLICHRFPEVHLNIKFIFYSSSLCGRMVHFASTTNGTLGTLESIERHISVVATTLDCGHICYWPLRTPVQHSCCLAPVFPLLTHRLVVSPRSDARSHLKGHELH